MAGRAFSYCMGIVVGLGIALELVGLRYDFVTFATGGETARLALPCSIDVCVQDLMGGCAAS